MSPTRRPARKAAKAEKAPEPEPKPFVAHLLVPPHEVLSEAETAEVLKRLGTLVERLPRVLITDPGLKTDPKFRAAREAHETLKGRLVRVRRPSPTAGSAVAYRILVSSSGE